MADGRRSLESIVADIADDVSIDWSKAAASEPGLRQIRIIAAIGAGRVEEPSESPTEHFVSTLLRVIAAVAFAKILLGIAAAVTVVPIRLGPRALMTVAFGLSGAFLMLSGRKDPRARALGSLFVIIGASFTRGYFVRATGLVGVPAPLFLHLATEAFLPCALWSFAWTFPASPRTRRAKQLGIVGVGLSIVVGVLLGVLNLVSLPGLALANPTLSTLVAVATRGSSFPLFWPLIMMTGALAFPYLWWKTLSGTVEERNRVSFLALAVIVGLSPVVVAVVVSSVVPGVPPSTMDAIGLALYVAMAGTVLATIYAVLVRKVLDVHLIIRRALQHSLARQCVWTLILGCIVYVAFSLYVGRERALADLLRDQAGLMSLASVGLLMLTFRSHLLEQVDRVFERGSADYSEVLDSLSTSLAGHRNIRELHQALVQELVRSMRVVEADIVVLNETRSAYVSLRGAGTLPVSSALPSLFFSSREALHVSGAGFNETRRLLPREDSAWLRERRVDWLFPLLDSSEGVLGLACIQEKEGFSFSRTDRVLISAMVDQVALRMENLSLRPWSTDAGVERSLPVVTMDWSNEPGMQCPACGQVSGQSTRRCVCEVPLIAATVPAVLNGKFYIERVLGSGGMGVVYSAIDATLKRRVAIKTMPTITPKHVARLEHEAQAMASVGHPNLATIFSVERWRDVPLLVVEHLDGGTLAEALRAGSMSGDDVLELGILLADALDRMHAGGLLHRDIKPSNIGFSSDGVVKLLDFGLAAMLDSVSSESEGLQARLSPREWTAMLEAYSPTATVTFSRHLVGTPLYLSPEAIAGEEANPSFDLWSLALVLFEALAGRHPLAGYPSAEVMRRVRSVRMPDVRDFRPDCPPEVAAFLNDALSLVPDRRPATAAAFRMRLQTMRPPFGTLQAIRG